MPQVVWGEQVSRGAARPCLPWPGGEETLHTSKLPHSIITDSLGLCPLAGRKVKSSMKLGRKKPSLISLPGGKLKLRFFPSALADCNVPFEALASPEAEVSLLSWTHAGSFIVSWTKGFLSTGSATDLGCHP